ncbi:MAG: GNAT family N-acetyltransferase [Desulfobacteraceae bacterium]|nr:MAG: GNAT family N-acetyltransferase [Desulfobacteraceae bacterium]
MADMIVHLYALPSLHSSSADLHSRGFTVRRAMAYEREAVVEWVHTTFNRFWASECATAFGRQPIGCYIAVQEKAIKGFCCVESTFRNFAGPIGVDREVRGQGLGGALLNAGLEELRQMGYAYAIIGDAGEPSFFAKTAGAAVIDGSTPGPYPPRLR